MSGKKVYNVDKYKVTLELILNDVVVSVKSFSGQDYKKSLPSKFYHVLNHIRSVHDHRKDVIEINTDNASFTIPRVDNL